MMNFTNASISENWLEEIDIPEGGKNASNLVSWLWKKQFYEAIWNILPPIMIPCGLVCNVCAFLVLLQPRLRSLVVHLPLTVLSLVDCLVLLMGLLRHWLRKASYFRNSYSNNLDPQILSDFTCFGFEMLLYLSLMYSSWIITVIAVERFVTICVNTGSRVRAFLISKRGLVIVLATVFTALLGCNLHFPFIRRINNNSSKYAKSCENADEYKYFTDIVFPRIDLVLTAFLPFIVILTCNLLIVAKLRSVRKSSVLGNGQSKLANYRTTVMLLLTSFAFVALTSPAKLYLTVFGGPYPNWVDISTESEAYYSYRVGWSVLLVLQFSNHCCNFLLYCASNPQFKREAVRLLYICCFCCRGRCGTSPQQLLAMQSRSRQPTVETPPAVARSVV